MGCIQSNMVEILSRGHQQQMPKGSAMQVLKAKRQRRAIEDGPTHSLIRPLVGWSPVCTLPKGLLETGQRTKAKAKEKTKTMKPHL